MRVVLSGGFMKITKFGKQVFTLALAVLYASIGFPLSANPADKIGSEYNYNGDDLGFSLNDDETQISLKCWAPLAKSVKVLFYKDSSDFTKASKTLKMVKDSQNRGIWTITCDLNGNKYYQYEIQNPSLKAKVCDIWAKAASPNSVATQITNINKDKNAIPENTVTDKEWGTQNGYYNPFGDTGKTQKAYSDAVLYEMHIRDWSYVEVKDSKGKFKVIADGEKVISHLKDLGITHVQLLPSFEYAETNENGMYNWGYNPYNYNVPEGRYVTQGYRDGTQAVKEMRYMISKLHENGIAVVMDVVFNHTSGTGLYSLYDSTVPGYFYRMIDDETYSSGSGCGNELATSQPMVKKFIIDSLKHWMLDYHVNGFRFDLMGLHERETMKEIYNELVKIDPNVMVYGEPWTGGKSLVKFGVTKSTIDDVMDDLSVNGVGCFNDDFRDSIRGNVFNATEKGFITGNYANFGKILTGLTGSVRGKGLGGFTQKIGRSINYIECHDNHTLFDRLVNIELGKATTGKLLEEISEEQLKKIIMEDKLGAALVILAQGTPFLNGGQEFLRTKNGNGNSYIAGDAVNGIDLSFKERYSDVYNTYKALIALRKANPESFGKNENAEAQMILQGLIKYRAGNFTVYFNAAPEALPITDSGKQVFIDEKSGTYTIQGSTKITQIPAKSFIILQN